MYDRLRAKPPTTDVERWQEGTVREVTASEGDVEVTVAPADGPGPVVVTVTEAIFDLFAGRLDPPAETHADAVDENVWYR